MTQQQGKIVHYGNVAQRRELEYPSMQKQLETLWKALDELQIAGVVHFSQPIQDMLVKVKAVQIKFPNDPSVQ